MNKAEVAAALSRAALAAAAATTMATTANAAPTTSTSPRQTVQNTVSDKNGLERTTNIKEVSPQGKNTTRHVYNWQDVIAQYSILDASNFSKDAKLSKNMELQCAAELRAVIRYEAQNGSAIEDKFYHDNLLGKITDTQLQQKIDQAKSFNNNKTLTQLIAEETATLENNKDERKKALEDLKNFRAQDDLHKGITLTDKVDAQIELNAQNSKTFTATMFLNKLRQNG